MSVQVIGSGGQRVTAVGSPSKRVDAAAVRIVGAGSGGAGLFRTQFHELLGDPYTLDDTDGVIGGAGTVTLPEAIEAEPRAWVISAFSGDVTLETDGEPIFDLGNGVTEPYVIPAGAVVHLLRYVGVWRIIYDSAVLDAAGGGASVAVVAVAVGDGGDDIDLDGAGPDDVGLVLVWGRSSGNGVYDVSVADGWVLVDPQPTTVIAMALVDGSTFMPVLNSGVWSLYTYAEFEGGWTALGSVPNLGGNSGQVWGTTGWVTPDGGVELSDAAPQDLGTAAAGVSTEASRADHVHAMPTAADIAVDASGFNGNLTTSDDTVQEVAQKLDDLVIPAAGIPDPGGANDDFLQRKSGAWTNRTIAQVRTDLAIPPLRPAAAYSASEDAGLHFPVNVIADTSNQSVAYAQHAWWWLFWVPTSKQVTVDVRVATLESGATARLSLWTTTDGAKPGTLIEDMGTVSAASIGVKSLTSAASVSGWVTVGVWQSNHTTVRYTRGIAGNGPWSPYGQPKDHQVGRAPYCWYANGLDYSSAWNPTLPTLALANSVVVSQPAMVWMRWT